MARDLSERDQYVASLLPRALENCHHEPGNANEVAICDLCQNKMLVLIGMLDGRLDAPEDRIH